MSSALIRYMFMPPACLRSAAGASALGWEPGWIPRINPEAGRPSRHPVPPPSAPITLSVLVLARSYRSVRAVRGSSSGRRRQRSDMRPPLKNNVGRGVQLPQVELVEHVVTRVRWSGVVLRLVRSSSPSCGTVQSGDRVIEVAHRLGVSPQSPHSCMGSAARSSSGRASDRPGGSAFGCRPRSARPSTGRPERGSRTPTAPVVTPAR